MKALLTIQGINSSQGYLFENAKVLNQFYDRIDQAGVDNYFNKNEGVIFKLLGKFGAKLDDVWDFYISNEERKNVCRATRDKILKLQQEGYEVDILAHSLGTVIAICCGPNEATNPIQVNKVILMQSPLGIANLLARMKTNSHAERYSKNFICNELIYTWSSNDYISQVITSRIIDILSRICKSTPKIYHSDLPHSSEDNLKRLLDTKEVFIKYF